MVLVTHVPWRLGIDDRPLGDWGGNGVSLFFVLSGYLLWRPFVSGRPNLRSYLLSRAGRILPAYWLAVVVLVALRGGDLLRYAVMLDGSTNGSSVPLGVLWTLQAEVQFYLVLPLLGLAGRPLLVPVMLGAASLALELAVAGSGAGGTPIEVTLPVRFWAFAPGMIVAALQPRADRRWLLAGAVTMLAAALALPLFPSQHSNVIAAVGAGLLVGWGINASPRPRWLWASGAAISYGLYLWHADLTELYGLSGAVGAFAVAGVSYVLLERPVMRWVRSRAAERRLRALEHQPQGGTADGAITA